MAWEAVGRDQPQDGNMSFIRPTPDNPAYSRLVDAVLPREMSKRDNPTMARNSQGVK